ncbi:MAG TPA: 4-hydroxythreonine-4-phosphate dehydrogenase PdxA [Gammaproteobacteria bacterium]|nr:4-hydroxythreonine-4-phosphate dehydrogenase PdxA [Gammaproteobacteria bacterium]
MSRAAVRIVLTPGEPAGIGPDLCLELAGADQAAQMVVAGDPEALGARARQLGREIRFREYVPGEPLRASRSGELAVLPVPLARQVAGGRPDPANAAAVLESLRRAARGCLEGEFDALVTGPVNKAVINRAGIAFSGHTEFLAEVVGGEPVMMLAAPGLRVVLVTTHLPLRAVPDAITADRLGRVIRIAARDLRERFGIGQPRLAVCGLNPHAGEDGHLGTEERDIIGPTLETLRSRGLDVRGPLPADTAFTPPRLEQTDAVVTMYHDQGLPVLKHLGFGRAVNITLGLPIIRTSVDHGTAFDLAGSGRADAGSLRAALDQAVTLVRAGSR